MKKTFSPKLKPVLKILGVIAVVGVLALQIFKGKPPASETWPLDDTKSTYSIHGVTKYDTGAGYYLYRFVDGNNQVVKIDPESPVELKHLTDREVYIEGYFKKMNGQTAVFLTKAELRK